jgi:excisionase family DNA binding protein
MPETFLTVDQAAARLQLSPHSVRIHLQRGKLRGVKRGRAWRVPESALFEHAPGGRNGANDSHTLTQVDEIWAAMASGDYARRNEAIRTLHHAPEAVRSIVMQRSGEAAERYYATPEGQAELADWRALDGEPFHDDLGDYDSEAGQ